MHPYPADFDTAKRSMELSLRWAKRSKAAHGENTAALFGIVQGGMHEELRSALPRRPAGNRLRRLAIGGCRWASPRKR